MQVLLCGSVLHLQTLQQKPPLNMHHISPRLSPQNHLICGVCADVKGVEKKKILLKWTHFSTNRFWEKNCDVCHAEKMDRVTMMMGVWNDILDPEISLEDPDNIECMCLSSLFSLLSG